MIDHRTPGERRRAQHQSAHDNARCGRWPIAGDKPVDAARTIASQLLRIIETAPDIDTARNQAGQLVERVRGWGQTWLAAIDDSPEGPFWSREQVAKLAGVTPNAVTNWTTRHGLTRYPQGYAEREVMDFLARRRKAA